MYSRHKAIGLFPYKLSAIGTPSPHALWRVLVGDGSQGCCMRLDVIAASLGHVRPPADKTKDSASGLGAKSVVF